MKRMKKLGLAFLLTVAMGLLCGCGNKDEATTAQEVTTEAVKETAEETMEVVTETAEETTEAVTETTEETTEAMSEETEEITEEELTMEAPELLYQGHASIRVITPEGKVIYIDPYAGTGYDLPADLILITHGHGDHTRTDLIEAKNEYCETINYMDALEGGTHQTFDLGYVQVEAVEAGYNANHNVKNCVGYILTFSNGATLYVTGDTSTTPQMDELADRNLSYAFFCCDGVFNMDTAEASTCAEKVAAKHSIPYHMVSATDGDFDQSVAETFNGPGRIILAPGDVLKLEP